MGSRRVREAICRSLLNGAAIICLIVWWGMRLFVLLVRMVVSIVLGVVSILTG